MRKPKKGRYWWQVDAAQVEKKLHLPSNDAQRDMKGSIRHRDGNVRNNEIVNLEIETVYERQARELRKVHTLIDDLSALAYNERAPKPEPQPIRMSRWLTRDNQIILLLAVPGERVTRYILVESYGA